MLNPALSAAPMLARIVPFALYIGFMAIGGLLHDPMASYTIRIGIVAAALLLFAGAYAELRNVPKTRAFEWMVAAVVGTAVFLLWIHLDVPWLSMGQEKSFDPTAGGAGMDWQMACVRLFGASAIVPIMEELFWRSFLLRSIDRGDFLSVDPKKLSWMALGVSSLLFGLEHSMWFAGIIAGLAYGWLYRRTANLWVPIFAHALTNLLLSIWIIRTANWQFW
jgi:hypothetical protein